MKRRSARKTVLAYGQMEERKLLAGAVYVDLVGEDLVVIGNYQDNVVSIDLNAETTDELVQGQDETNVRFSENFQDNFKFGETNSVRVYTGAGNDVVTIYGEGFSASDDLIVSLGHGDDSLYVVGGEFQDDVRVYGGSNHDSISLANLEIGDDLIVAANDGQDVIAVNGTKVQGRSILFGQYGHDTVLVNDSSFGEGVFVEMGEGSDRFDSTGSNYRDVLSVRGRQGWDSVMFDGSNRFSSTPHLHTMEYQASKLNSLDRSEEAIAQLKADFFEFGSQLTTAMGDAVQDNLSELAFAYDVALISLNLDAVSQTVSVEDPTPSISVIWDAAAQAAVAATAPGPTISTRAFAMVHTAIYDAWSAYDDLAISTTLDDDLQRPESENTETNKIEAMSYAAFRVLDDLFASQTELFESVMDELGFDFSNDTTDTTTAAGIGNRMAEALLEFRHDDGSNQLGDSELGTLGVAYSDTTDYEPVNPVGDSIDIESWSPEFVPIDSGPDAAVQEFLTPQWGDVESFSLESTDEFLLESPQPFLLVDGTVDLDAKTITLSDGTELDIDKSLIGTVINPEFISQAQEVVDISAGLTDEEKLIAEFWEDGAGTSFPGGTFMTFAQFVSARDNHSIDDDAKMFFALGNAQLDAGIAAWDAKVEYDYTRPVRAIRELGELGLIGEYNAELGGYAIEAWTPENGTQTILASEFVSYQNPDGDASPPFAEYVSGHSTFSAAGATILELFTGSDIFGASVTFEPGESRFETGTTPSTSVTLSWDTFTAAAEESGISRLYGGIHFTEGNINGLALGDEIGASVWEQAQYYFNGGVV